MPSEMTTTKIDRESLEKLRMLANRESRSAPGQLAVLIDKAFRANPAGESEESVLFGMMDEIAEAVERGDVTGEARRDHANAQTSGAISWGSEDGVVIGLLPDGTRVDVAGNKI